MTDIETKIISLIEEIYNSHRAFKPGTKISESGKKQWLGDIVALLQQSNREQYLKGVKDLKQEIDNNTMISEMYGWRGILDQSAENIIDRVNPDPDTGGDT